MWGASPVLPYGCSESVSDCPSRPLFTSQSDQEGCGVFSSLQHAPYWSTCSSATAALASITSKRFNQLDVFRAEKRQRTDPSLSPSVFCFFVFFTALTLFPGWWTSAVSSHLVAQTKSVCKSSDLLCLDLCRHPVNHLITLICHVHGPKKTADLVIYNSLPV